MTPDQNPQFPEGINSSNANPFRELLLLSSGIVIALIIISSLLWHILGWGASWVPMSWEARLADRYFEQLPQTEEEQALQTRIDTILNAMEYSATTEIRVRISESDVANAFALLGGRMVINRGLLDTVTSDIGLDMVLAHEAAHLVQRDPIRSAAGVLGIKLLVALVTGSDQVFESEGLLDLGSDLLLLSYSRDTERQADLLAIKTLKAMHGNLIGADEFFQNLINANEEALPEFLSTHPHPEKRRQWIQEAL